MSFTRKISLLPRIVLTVFIMLMAGFQLVGQNSVIPKNSEWKYDDSGSDLGTSWRLLIFNDNSWESGLGILGYGEEDTGTEISFGVD